jgi:RNA polymerase sigma-70 factor (ECF subfamily)
MMPTEMTNGAQQDESAVAAVRRGDAERYRELVERHERRVFAVAWSRLGDAALAEEAAQEAFIRGYRRLWLLGDGAKFAAWITTIARHAAINLGLRHRRELNKRERWALEQPAAAGPVTGETTELCTPEMLRQTLAELPAAHRECLVLFYLEGRSGAEAAATLGISEVALRVRLHRARAALRERLEDKLEGSLANLRPAKTLVPAVMATVLTSSPAKLVGGGVGAKILYCLLPFKFFFLFMWAMMILPSLLLGLVTTRLERANLRDPEGFRARMYRKSAKRMLWVLPLLLGVPLLIAYFSSYALGTKGLFLLLAAFLLPAIFFGARQFAINRTRFRVTTFLSLLIMIPGYSAIGMGWLPVSANSTIMMFYILLFVIGYGSRPMRMDYNLFRRALQKMLETNPTEKSSTETKLSLNKSQLLTFARFLGNRLLVVDYLWRGQGLILRLPALKTVSLWDALGSFGFYSTSGRRFSYLMLEWNGTVSAQLGIRDEEALLVSEGRALPDAVDLEKQVAVAVESAWRHFCNGDSAMVERALGQVPETDIFIVPPARSKAVRLQRGVMIFFLALMLVLNGLIFFKPAWMGGVRPVNVTEAQVRTTLAGFGQTSDGYSVSNGLNQFLCYGFVFPPTNLFAPEVLHATRQEVFKAAGFDPHGDLESKYERLGNAWLLGKAVTGGWINFDEVGVDTTQMSEALHNPKPYGLKFHFELSHRQCNNEGTNYTVVQVDSLILAQLRLLQGLKCLDLVDLEIIIPHLCALQVLSGEASAGRPPLRNWRNVRGLFYTPGWPALQDTYCDLAALEILGGLDKIDLEACVTRILKLHRGKGYFTSPGFDSHGDYGIDGDARDTIAAFESLRILGALDRVKDLDKWQFRVESYRSSKPNANGLRILTWDEIEAWVCQQRLEKILREHRANPSAPYRSLLEP